MLNRLFELYAREGFSLKENGLNEAVISNEVALQLLGIFSELKILVLGGDLYEKDKDNHFVNIYGDWYYEGNSFMESIEVARNHLSQYENDLFISFTFRDGYFVDMAAI